MSYESRKYYNGDLYVGIVMDVRKLQSLEEKHLF
jgi:hypothetical protein